MPTVGVINPSIRGGKPEQLIEILPPEVALEIDNCNIAKHSVAELEAAFPCFDEKAGKMASLRVDLIHPAGVSFLLLGPDAERRMVEAWETRHNIPVFTNPMSHVSALRAFGARRIVSAAYMAMPINRRFTDYLVQAGFEVLETQSYEQVSFAEIPNIPRDKLRVFFGALCERNPDAQALNLFGPGWRASFDLIDEIETTYGIPVIHHVAAQSWEIQRRLGLARPVDGRGRLVRDLPPAVQ